MTRGTISLSTLLLLLGSIAFAQPDAEGTKDHPDVPRFPGFYITVSTQEDFAKLEMPLDDNYLTKEGKLFQVAYELKEGAKRPSSTELLRNYVNAFKKHGGKALYTYDDNSTAEATLVMPLGNTERYLVLHYSGDGYKLDILDVKEMVQQIEVSASDMAAALDKNGFVALHILFDTGKATIKSESTKQLDEVVSLLKAHDKLALAIEGHTDNVGKAAANLTLSKERGESVKKYLVAKGIAAARLSAAGYGDTRPVADNRTEEGRAQNRRVELVKK